MAPAGRRGTQRRRCSTNPSPACRPHLAPARSACQGRLVLPVGLCGRYSALQHCLPTDAKGLPAPRLLPMLLCGSTDRQPQRLEGGPPRPCTSCITRQRPALCSGASPSGGHGAPLLPPGHLGGRLLPKPGEAGDRQHRTHRPCAWAPPSSTGALARAPLPAEEHRPCLTATPSPRTARTGARARGSPRGPPAGSMCCMSIRCVCPPLTDPQSDQPRRPHWPTTSAPRWRPPRRGMP